MRVGDVPRGWRRGERLCIDRVGSPGVAFLVCTERLVRTGADSASAVQVAEGDRDSFVLWLIWWMQ